MLAGSTDRDDKKINNAVLALNAAGRLGVVYCSTAHDAVLGFVTNGKNPNWLKSYVTIRPPSRPDGTVPESNVRGINSHGHICGKYDADGYVSTDVPGAYADVRLVLPAPPAWGGDTRLNSIDNHGLMTGSCGNPPRVRHGFLCWRHE